MNDVESLNRSWTTTRAGAAAAWISAISCLPYLIFKVLWTVGIPLGISDESVLDDNDWMVGNAAMAVVQLAALALVVALVRPWSRRLPAWLLLFPAWVGTGLLFQVIVGAALFGVFSDASTDSPVSSDPIRPWVYVLVYSAFAVQGTALAVAFTSHVRNRWGHLFDIRRDELVLRDTVHTPSWPERHFIEIAVTVAWMALVTAIVYSFWSGGGAFALAGNESERKEAAQVARATGAALAALGLFGLAGRWGLQIRIRLPAALLWIGSGALVAFDGLSLAFNGLASLVGTDSTSQASWELTDTVLLVKVLVGLFAAVVGLVAIRLASTNDNDHRPTPRMHQPRRHNHQAHHRTEVRHDRHGVS